MMSRFAYRALAAATALTAFAAAPASAQQVDRIVTFGDSYADDGNAFQLGFPPQTAYPTGRFSGGTNYIDTLAQILGVPVENFAIGGAEAGTVAGTQNTLCLNVASFCDKGLKYQVDAYFNGGGGTAYPVVTPGFNEDDLLTVSIGGNDARVYQLTGGTFAGAPTVALASASAATTQLDRLVAAGAPTISFLAGDTGTLPEVSANPSAAAIRSSFSSTFNTAMQSTLAGYAADGVMVHYLDLNAVLQSIAVDPAAYGLTSLGPCPAAQATQCVTDSSFTNRYLFYVDGLHLTSRGFAVIAQYVAAQLDAPLTLQATSDLAIDTAHQWGRTLTSRLDLGAPRDGDMPEGMHAYLVGDTFSRTVDATGRNNQFKVRGVGATAGLDYGFGSGVVGAAVNYSRPSSDFTNDSAETKTRSVQVGAYAGFGVAGAFAQGYLGYGWDKHDLKRQGVVPAMFADADGHHWVAGAKGGYLMPMGTVRVGPIVALDYAKVKVDGYTEEGDPALNLNVDSVSHDALRGSIGAELRGDFGGGGVQIRPYVSAVFEKPLSGDDRSFSFSQTTAPTIINSWETASSKKGYGRLSGGMSAGILDGISLDVAMSATVGKDFGNDTSGHLGIRAAF